ncbi:MAG: zinc metalloprotease HtpX [Candidatus Zixiibacteriota bacterium]
MNTLKTLLFLTVLTVLLIVVGGLLGGRNGMIVALVFAAIMNFGSYWFSDKIVIRMFRGRKIEEKDNPRLFSIVRRTSQSAQVPMPKVYIIPSESPNAFATGRNPKHAAVAVTQGILRILNEDELEGVISHEMAHVKNRDILTQSIVATLAGAISMLAFMARFAALFGGYGGRDSNRGGGLGLLVMAIIAPILALLIQMAISRSREFAADETGANISHKPLHLANALKKLHNASRKVPLQANPATAHIFIVNPLTTQNFASLFSTHPPVQKRIDKLYELAKKM